MFVPGWWLIRLTPIHGRAVIGALGNCLAALDLPAAEREGRVVVNSTETVNLPSAATSRGSFLASDAETRGTWANPAARIGLGMAAKPTNPRSLSPLEWLSP
jgi:hypothetical protein